MEDVDIDMSALTSTERAFALGYRKGLQEARAELNEEVRAIRARYEAELARLQQTVTAIRQEHSHRQALIQAIAEREALRPKLLH